jgi:glycosyltransferase involved in cell wall biosynthesis
MTESVTAVIAAHNEQATVAAVVRGVLAHTSGLGEVLVVDDGSTDGTAEAAHGVGAVVVHLTENRGKGAALREGIAAASGEVLLFIDADGQDDPAEIRRLQQALTPETAMVIGSRFLGTFKPGAVKPWNWLGNRLLTAIFNRLFGCRLTDTQAGFRLVRREVIEVEQLRAVRYEIETELTALVLRRGGRVVEVPVTRERRAHGASGFRSIYHGLRILGLMLARRWRKARPDRA